MPHKHKVPNIVIVGAGFAGLAAALALEKQRGPEHDYNVTLIDKNCYHCYHALLYEVATAKADIDPKELEAIQRGVCVRIKALENITLKKNIHAVQAVMSDVDIKRCQVMFGQDAPMMYDYLILALGSVPNYFHIPGLAEHSVPVKELPDALKIHVRLQELMNNRHAHDWPIRVIIGGGGVSGVEVAAELAHSFRRRQHPISIEIIEGSPTLLNGLEPWMAKAAQQRLESLGVECRTNTRIVEADAHQVKTMNGVSLPFDLLIWCGGIQAHPIYKELGVPVNPKGQVVVAPELHIPDHDRIFVVGDGASIVNPITHTPVPQVAPVAVEQGELAAANILRHIHQQKMEPYRPVPHGYVIPVGARWALSTLGGAHRGWFAWVQRKWVDLKYFMSILRWQQALKVWWLGGRAYLRND